AMMALFLLLWLVSITTQEQREGIANWFNPMAVDESQSASDGMLAGQAVDVEGAQKSKNVEGDSLKLESGDPEVEQLKVEQEKALEEAIEKGKVIEEENEILAEVME